MYRYEPPSPAPNTYFMLPASILNIQYNASPEDDRVGVLHTKYIGLSVKKKRKKKRKHCRASLRSRSKEEGKTKKEEIKAGRKIIAPRVS